MFKDLDNQRYEELIAEKKIGLLRKIFGGFFLFILILIVLYFQYVYDRANISLSIPGISILFANIIWVSIFILITWALLDNKVGFGIEMGLGSGFMYGACQLISLSFMVSTNTSYMMPSFFLYVLIIGPLFGILFGIIFHSLYRLLPGNTVYKKSIILGVIFWFIFIVLAGSFYITEYSLIDYIIYWVAIGFCSVFLLSYFFGFLWRRNIELKLKSNDDYLKQK